jgi:serine/threonine-protein kinase
VSHAPRARAVTGANGTVIGEGAGRVTGLHATVAMTPTPTPALAPRLGRYQIITRIATGGMAEVYLAVHGELSGFRTPVVLKKVLPHLASNPQFIDMFLDEARIASLLDHPNVVRIYEVGRTGDEYFLAMELVQGKPLSAVIRRAFERQEQLDHKLAALIIAHAAAGLHHAHELTDVNGAPLGLVHRDVSPQNILVSFEGSVKVIDFGIARALGRISDTQTGGMKGKFGYMSPEQARSEEVDVRTDIFALGVVLWEAICGRRLFHRENDLATMRALLYDQIPKPSSLVKVAPELETIVLRALTRNQKFRYQTAREMGSALERYIVQAGGASVSDLSVLMKTFFAQDITHWQQTVRSAIHAPSVPDQPPAPYATTELPVGALAAAAGMGHEARTPSATSRPSVTLTGLEPPGASRRRSLLFAGGLGVVAVAGVLLGRALRAPSPATAPAPGPATTSRPVVEPARTAAPDPPAAPAGESSAAPTAPTTKVGRKRKPPPGKPLPGLKPPARPVDRKVNPF